MSSSLQLLRDFCGLELLSRQLPNDAPVRCELKNAVEKFIALLKATKIFDEMFNDSIRFIEVAASCVRGNVTVRDCPE
jgi:hypothetical protein